MTSWEIPVTHPDSLPPGDSPGSHLSSLSSLCPALSVPTPNVQQRKVPQEEVYFSVSFDPPKLKNYAK